MIIRPYLFYIYTYYNIYSQQTQVECKCTNRVIQSIHTLLVVYTHSLVLVQNQYIHIFQFWFLSEITNCSLICYFIQKPKQAPSLGTKVWIFLQHLIARGFFSKCIVRFMTNKAHKQSAQRLYRPHVYSLQSSYA